MTALESRKRPSLSVSGSIDDFNGGLNGSKSQRPESPRKRARPRSSALRFHNSVKDLRSHRIFSPNSELYRDMVTQKLGFEFGSVDSEKAEAEQIGVGIQKGTEVSVEKCENPSIGNDSKTKSFIRPCVREKLFIAPGSLSYKRLLPYLSESNQRDRGIARSPKLDKSSEDKKLQTVDRVQSDEASEEGVNKDRFPGTEHHGGDSNSVDKVGLGVDCKLIETVQCSSEPSANGHIQKSDTCLSPQNSVANGLDTLAPPIDMDEGIPRKVLDGGSENTGFASAADGSDIVRDDELGKLSENTEQLVLNVMNQVDNQKEESNQMTPPDAEIFVEREEEISEAETADIVMLNMDKDINGDVSNGVNHGIAGLDYKTRHGISSKCGGAVLKPRSRAKLFRSPGSLSYRRMLPFLMDIAKDNLDSKATIKLEKTCEKDSVQPAPQSNVGFEENRGHASFEKPMPVPTDNKNLISPENGNEIRVPISAKKEDSILATEVSSDSNGTLETPLSNQNSAEHLHDNNQPTPLVCSNISESKSIEPAMSENSLVTSEADGKSLRSIVGFDDKPREPFSQFDNPVPSRTLGGGLKRGILRSNPRGCRGLCTCLNCASFRLNADRAFEFSRNQMEDTEELVLGLVNELSYLRSVLEKSADLGHDHLITHVKEACKKAFEAEEAAKNRLSHMNYDLGVHCRTTCVEGPRVKFANRVEKVEANVSGDEVLKEDERVLQAATIGKHSCTIV